MLLFLFVLGYTLDIAEVEAALAEHLGGGVEALAKHPGVGAVSRVDFLVVVTADYIEKTIRGCTIEATEVIPEDMDIMDMGLPRLIDPGYIEYVPSPVYYVPAPVYYEPVPESEPASVSDASAVVPPALCSCSRCCYNR